MERVRICAGSIPCFGQDGSLLDFVSDFDAGGRVTAVDGAQAVFVIEDDGLSVSGQPPDKNNTSVPGGHDILHVVCRDIDAFIVDASGLLAEISRDAALDRPDEVFRAASGRKIGCRFYIFSLPGNHECLPCRDRHRIRYFVETGDLFRVCLVHAGDAPEGFSRDDGVCGSRQ